MASTTISSGQNSRGFTFFLTLSEGTQSLTDNYTPISWSLKLSCSSTGYGFSSYGVGWNCNIDGASVTYHDRYTSDRYSCTNGSTWTIASGTKNVTHNNDGTKVLSVSGTLDMASSPYGAGSMSFSGNFTLTDIPRQSTFTISNGTLNTAQNIVITSNVNTYRHTLRYECGSATGTINSTRIPASNATSATQSWTPPLSLAAQNTTGESVSVTVYCDTYTAASGGTLIGTSSVTVTMAIPASVKPSVTVSTACNPAAHLTTYGGYVQGKSTVTVSFTPTMSQGATIASRTVKIGNAQTYSPTSNSVTSTVLTEAGASISIQVTVTDSRGRSGTASTTIKVLAYEDPKITAISMIRTNSSGTALATGEYAKVTFSSSVSALGNHNTATYKLYYKTSTASSYSNVTLSSYANNYAVSNGTNIFSAAVANSYMAYITVQDAFKTVTSVTVRVQSSAAFFSLDADNNAFSFGKLETIANTFQVAWNTVIDGTLKLGTSVNDVANDLLTNVIFHGTCPTAAATTAKVATVSGTFPSALSVGTTVMITFSNTNTGAVGSLTLNVNGTGAKSIKYLNNTGTSNLSSAGQLQAGRPIMFIYDGSYWLATGINYNTTYSALTQADADTGTATTGRLITAAVLDTTIKTKFADYVLEQGTADSASGGSATLSWTYRKWNSGVAECWSKASWSVASFTLWSNGVYEGSPRPWWNFPSGLFNAVPFLQALHCTDGGTWFQDVITDGGTKTVSAANTCAFCALRPNNYAPLPITTHLYAKGTWK